MPSVHTAGLNTLKAAVQAFGLHGLHRWLRAIVASGTLALDPAPTELQQNGRERTLQSASANTSGTGPGRIAGAACVYCAMAPPCNVRILPCQHLSCHVCLLDSALKVQPPLDLPYRPA
jgi:hypothetical protein